MPELQENYRTFGMDGRRNGSPTFYLLLRMNTGSRRISLSRCCDLRRLCDNQTTICRALLIMCSVKIARNVPRLARPHSSEGGHNNPVLQEQSAYLQRREKKGRSHEGSAIQLSDFDVVKVDGNGNPVEQGPVVGSARVHTTLRREDDSAEILVVGCVVCA
jgi:hypothetical protein